MSSPSPACTVKDGAGSPQATTNGTTATAANVITIALASTAGVNSWSLTLFGQDEVISPPTVTVNNTNKTATFTAPALPWSLIYQSTVNGGVDVNGVVQASYSTTFKICCLTAAGKRLAASNETTENNATTGWTSILNDTARNPPGAGAVPTGTGFRQVIANVEQATAQKIPLNNTTYVTGATGFANGGTGLSALGSGLQVLRTNAGATAMEWATASAFTAGTDLAGTTTNQTVVQITGADGLVEIPSAALNFGTGTRPTTALIRFPYYAGAQSLLRGMVAGATEADIIQITGNTLTFGTLNGYCNYYGFAINLTSASSAVTYAQSGGWQTSATYSYWSSYLGDEAFRITPVSGGTTNLSFASTVTLAQIGQAAAAAGVGAHMNINAQVGASASNSGDLQIGGGASGGGGGLAGFVDFRNQTLSNTATTIGAGQLLTGLLAQFVPIKVGGVAMKMVVLAT